ncbi:MAG TPA: carbohydrate ABC transporter permease [Clostridiales bacterium]|nr:carbohydrate ABC transporter permease [Clostridiales bacterium]
MIGKKSFGSKLFDISNILIVIMFSIFCVYPFYYMLCYSLSDPVLATKGITLWVRGFTFNNYINVIKLKEIPQAALVSVTRTILGSSVTLFCSGFFAYLMTQQKMYFRKFIYRFVILTMYVGGGLIPTYLVMRYLGLRNNFLVYILPGAVSAYYVILIKTFIEQLPQSLEESAKIEGAGILMCWFRIIMPLSKPILATIVVFTMVGQWNSWFDAMIYMTRNNLKPLQLILYEYLQEAQRLSDRIREGIESGVKVDVSLTPDAIRMTVTAVITIPILLVYPFMQRYFVKGIMIGAVKG